MCICRLGPGANLHGVWECGGQQSLTRLNESLTQPPGMLALCYNESEGQLQLRRDHPLPLLKEGEAVCKVLLAGICSTDLEIIKGYVPGYNSVLGHEFVVSCSAASQRRGQWSVGACTC